MQFRLWWPYDHQCKLQWACTYSRRRHDKRGQVKKYIQTDTVNYNVHEEEISCTGYFLLSIKKQKEKKRRTVQTTNELNIDRLFTQKINCLLVDHFVSFLLRSVISWHKFSIIRKCQQRLFQFIIFMQMNRFANYDKFIMDCFKCMEIASAA